MGEEKQTEMNKCQPEAPVPSPSFSSYSDGFIYDQNDEKLEYGPGIVDKLRNKFLNLMVKEKDVNQPLRRVSSLEQLLKSDTLATLFHHYESKISGSTAGSSGKTNLKKCRLPARRKYDVLKKARSMETLVGESGGGCESSTTDEKKRVKKFGNLKKTVGSECTNVVGSVKIDAEEMPKPDTVSNYMKLFENGIGKNENKKMNRLKSTTAGKNVKTASTKNSNSTKFPADEPQKVSWIQEATAHGLLKTINDEKPRENSVINNQNCTELPKPDEKQQKLNEPATEKTEENQRKQTQTFDGLKDQQPKPKVVNLKPKPEEKPIGLIRPLPLSPTQENLINKSLNSENLLLPFQRLKKSSPVSPESGNSIVFNFTRNEDVTPNICNYQNRYSAVRPVVRIDKSGKLVSNVMKHLDGSGIVLIPGLHVTCSQDYSDEDDEPDSVVYPCGIQFEGENVVIGKSCLLKNRNKQLKTTFFENGTNVYEYPAENFDEDFSADNGEEEVDSVGEREQVEESSLPSSDRISNSSPVSVNLGGGLGNYVPSKRGEEEEFQLGVSRPTAPDNVPTNKLSPSGSEETTLTPADDSEAFSWSSSQTVETTDLLF